VVCCCCFFTDDFVKGSFFCTDYLGIHLSYSFPLVFIILPLIILSAYEAHDLATQVRTPQFKKALFYFHRAFIDSLNRGYLLLGSQH
jgi:hypothetical protein